MKEQSKKQLNEILNQYDKKQADAQEVKVQQQTEEEMFLEEFKKLRKEVIRPVFESIGNELKGRGHDYKIDEQEITTDAQGRTLPPRINMKIYPSGVERSEYRSDTTPNISLVADLSKKNVYTHVSTIQPNRGGSAGARDFLAINEIDADTVEKHVLKAVTDIFSPGY